MYPLTQEDFAKGLLDKDATKIIEREIVKAEDVPTGLADTSDWKLQGLGGPEGNQAFNLGDLWNNLKEKYKENQNWEPTYPTEPDNLRQRRLEKEYPDLREEPQEFSKTGVNRKVAELVSDTALAIAKKHPEWVGLENDYIADGTKDSNRPQFAQQIFDRPDADRNLSDKEFIELLKRLGVDSSPWGGDDSIPPKKVLPNWATDGRTWES